MPGLVPAMTKWSALSFRFALFGGLPFLRGFLRDLRAFRPRLGKTDRDRLLAALTFRPERPLFNVPALRFFIARSTLADAFFEYFRAMIILPVAGK
jgi:hypothetical protein